MNEKQFGSFKLLKLKYRRWEQIIQLSCRIVSPKKKDPTLLNLWKFQKSENSTPESYIMHWDLMNDHEFGYLTLLKLKYRRRDKIIQLFCSIGSPKKLDVPLQFAEIFNDWEKYSLIIQNALKCNEWQRNQALKTVKIEIQKRDHIIKPFFRIGFPQEIMSCLFNFWKFEKSEKSTPESWRMDWNLTNDEEFGSLKLSKLKCRRGNQIIQPFCRIGSPHEIRFSLFNLGKF